MNHSRKRRRGVDIIWLEVEGSFDPHSQGRQGHPGQKGETHSRWKGNKRTGGMRWTASCTLCCGRLRRGDKANKCGRSVIADDSQGRPRNQAILPRTCLATHIMPYNSCSLGFFQRYCNFYFFKKLPHHPYNSEHWETQQKFSEVTFYTFFYFCFSGLFVSPLLILSIILIKLTKAAFDSNILLKFRLDSRLPIDGKIKWPRWRNCELEFLLFVIFARILYFLYCKFWRI